MTETACPPDGFNGPNGMIADKDGAVLLCQHGNRRIARIGKDMKVSTLVDKFEGKKFNSPNDLVFHSDGSLYFTDPPYGLPKGDDDPTKEIKFNGVFRLANGKLQAIVKDLTRPNGIAFSPTKRRSTWPNSDLHTRSGCDTISAERNGQQRQGVRGCHRGKGRRPAGRDEGGFAGQCLCHGSRRHLGILSGRQALGTIKPPETPANCGWGDDGKTLYMTARTGLYRIKLAVAGEKLVY